MSSNPIRVIVADDHGMVRRGIISFLKNDPDIHVIGEAQDGRQAVELCERLQPDVVLMDLQMPEMDGVAATRAIRKQSPQIHIIALTSFQDRDKVQEALQAGAISYLLKNVSGDDLAAAIRDARAGRATLAQEAVHALIQPPRAPSAPGYDLTPREREVLALLVEGLSNNEIAERLSVSHATAKAHVSNILSKLGASNRAEAVARAVQQRIVN
ncbi:MAG: response regulator transcription factor [Chloroflexi bacterium]|nr:response regulator transcription factor [Chloroflexota bacterium]